MTGIEGLLKIVAGMLVLGVSTSLLAAEKDRVVVMLGDSTTLCSRNEAGAKLTDFVQAQLSRTLKRVTVVNSGKGSDTASGGYARLQEAVFAHDPAVVTISFGLNDTGLFTPGEYLEWMEKIVQTIKRKSHARILLVTSTPFDNARHPALSKWGKGFRSELGLDEYMDANICAQVRKLAKKHNLPVCDLHSYFSDKFRKTPALIKTLIMPDGVHLTDEGNKVAAECLAPMIATALRGSNAGGAR